MIQYRTADRVWHGDRVRVDDEIGVVDDLRYLDNDMMSVIVEFEDGKSYFLVPDSFEFELVGRED